MDLATQSGATNNSCIKKAGIIVLSSRRDEVASCAMELSSVDFTKHYIDRADEGDHIGYQMADRHALERLQIDVGRRANPHAIRFARAVAHQVDAQLSLRRFNRVIDLSDRRLDYLRHFCHHRTFGKPVQRLLDNGSRLPHLRHAYEIAIIRVAVFAERDLE